jgi:N-acetylneuraminic acid mutarotase
LGYNDIWSLEFENVAWESTVLELPGLVWKKREVLKGKMPSIKFCDGEYIGNNEMIFFGGYNPNGEPTRNFYTINFDDMSVTQNVTKGRTPSPRAMHRMMKIKDDIIAVYGGTGCNEEYFKQNTHQFLNDIYIYYVKDFYWAQPTIGGPTPDSRFDFAFTCIFSRNKKCNR